jgi:hypothetical protein
MTGRRKKQWKPAVDAGKPAVLGGFQTFRTALLLGDLGAVTSVSGRNADHEQSWNTVIGLWLKKNSATELLHALQLLSFTELEWSGTWLDLGWPLSTYILH